MRILLLILLLLKVPTAYAFEPQKHAGFSNDAIALYQSYTGKVVSGKAIQALAKGAEDEDNKTPSRGLNWHFYNNGKKIGKYSKFLIFRCNGSNEKIFGKRVKKLHTLILAHAPVEDIYAAAGRVAHHIQDMSSPPHVVPIYHTGKDLFDKHKTVTVPDLATDATYNLFEGDVISPCKLLDTAAKTTLAAAVSPVEFTGGATITGETWTKFWGGENDKKYKGFSTYGEYGNTFGIIIEPSDKSTRTKYDKTTFDNFFNECRNHAVINTVKLLLYIDNIMATVECEL